MTDPLHYRYTQYSICPVLHPVIFLWSESSSHRESWLKLIGVIILSWKLFPSSSLFLLGRWGVHADWARWWLWENGNCKVHCYEPELPTNCKVRREIDHLKSSQAQTGLRAPPSWLIFSCLQSGNTQQCSWGFYILNEFTDSKTMIKIQTFSKTIQNTRH